MEAGMLLLILTPDDPLEALMLPDCNSGLCWLVDLVPKGPNRNGCCQGPLDLCLGISRREEDSPSWQGVVIPKSGKREGCCDSAGAKMNMCATQVIHSGTSCHFLPHCNGEWTGAVTPT